MEGIMQEGSCLRIYLSEADKIDGKPAVETILTLCQQSGLNHVTVLRGIEGLGTHGMHSTSFLSLSSDLPILVEAIDTAEKIAAAVILLRPHLVGKLIATWPVSILKDS
jgi:PII-like signaling protein